MKSEQETMDGTVQEKGTRIGDYTFLQLIGIGSTGQVWLAHHTSGRFLAVKVLREEWLRDARQIQRLRDEGAIMYKLRHPGICRVYEVGETDGIHYVAMEFVDGLSLYDVLWAPPATWQKKEYRDWGEMVSTARDFRIKHPHEPMSPEPSILPKIEQTVDLMIKVCDAVAAAHKIGIPHRDLKPGNILLYQDGRPVVVDFGLAMLDKPSAKAGNGASEVLGTLEYMAPEQAQDSEMVTERADVYSLGAILYVMLTRKSSFEPSGSIREDLKRLMTHTPVPPRSINREIDPRLDAIVLKCLRKDPSERYASAGALRDDLVRYAQGEALRALSPSLAENLLRVLSKHRHAVLGSGLACLLILGATAFAFREINLRRAQAEEAVLRYESEKLRAQEFEARLLEKIRELETSQNLLHKVEREGKDAIRAAREAASGKPNDTNSTEQAEVKAWLEERDALVQTNRRLSDEILELREQIRSLTEQLASAREMSSQKSTIAESGYDLSGNAESTKLESTEMGSTNSVNEVPREASDVFLARWLDELAKTLLTGAPLVIVPPGLDRMQTLRRNYPPAAARLFQELSTMAKRVAEESPSTPADFELLITNEIFQMRLSPASTLLMEYHKKFPPEAQMFLQKVPLPPSENFRQFEMFLRAVPPGPKFQPQLAIMRRIALGYERANSAYTARSAQALFE